MSSFFYDSLSLPATKVDIKPVTNATRQWAAADANAVFTAITDIRTAINNGRVYDVKEYGAIGNGVADDAPAINAAIQAAKATSNGVFGAILYLPKGTYMIGSPIEVSNGVGLRGDGPASTILKATASFNADSIIKNETQNGTQEFCFLENFQVEGNKGNGAVCNVAAVDLVSLFINSYVRNLVILNSSSVGLRVAGSNGMGPVFFQNLWVLRSGGHNILVEEVVGNTHGLNGLRFDTIASEHQGTNSSALYLKGLGHSQQWNFSNIHIEQGTAATGRTAITIDGVSHVLMDGIQLEADLATVTNGIVITNVAQNVGIQIRGVTNQNLINPVLLDQKNSVTLGAINVNNYCTADVQYFGAPQFTPVASGKSIVFQNSSSVDRAWFDDLGRLTGSSVSSAGVDIASADAVNERVVALINFARDRAYGFYYSGNSLRLRYLTGGVDIMQFDTDGGVRFLSPEIGFFSAAAGTKPTITGSRGGNAALASLLSALATLGLLTDSTTA